MNILFETITLGDTPWVVRVMPDGRHWRVGRQRDLEATVDSICAVPEYGTYEATSKVWEDRAKLRRLAKLARTEIP